MGVSAAIIKQAESDMATECYIFAALMPLVSIALMFTPEKIAPAHNHCHKG